ncbi:hypothetical protein P6U16_14010 [Rhizobium sp. 32-5/1]|uniref:hypothetical protein n=1 Tax=Rhizobium sp. 32-5/1 TaxID=3019602 RepID=UPI00240D956B|nr:hypothetical protein [Rhizobium sp. 32-5/1]WEZ82275.1 hypothetical protein P6U16_14010 [Rhizobium sp. 32-5/1]
MKGTVSYVDLPSRVEVIERLTALAEGRSSPEDTAKWAWHWLVIDETPGFDVRIHDWAVWDALKLLSGADAHGWDRPYLYGEKDFVDWLKELTDAPVRSIPS